MKTKIRFDNEITLDEKKKYISYYDKDFSFGKWIDLANGISRGTPKQQDTVEDEELEDSTTENEKEGEE